MLQVIKFSAVWCGPCKMFEPVWDRVSKQYNDVTFTKVDIDIDPDMAAQFKVMAVPTIVFIKDAQEVMRKVGLIKEDEFKKLIESFK